jgi:hypothetical protein
LGGIFCSRLNFFLDSLDAGAGYRSFDSMRLSLWFSLVALLGLAPVASFGDAVENSAGKPAAEMTYQNPYLANASLAAFSVGSLAVGGVFYALQTSMDGPRVGFVGGDRSSLGTAVGAAGLTALIAGISYFYYSHRDLERARSWNASVSGGISPAGNANVSASIALPLSFAWL